MSIKMIRNTTKKTKIPMNAIMIIPRRYKTTTMILHKNMTWIISRNNWKLRTMCMNLQKNLIIQSTRLKFYNNQED